MKKKIIIGFVILCGLYLFSLTFFSKNLCPLRGSVSSEKFQAAAFLAHFGQSQAIPAFARKYDTNCQTCHTAFPNLTPFGEAFKRNGLRFPGEGTIYDSPGEMALGSPEDKEKFPKAVWPGVLPKSFPFSFVGASQYTTRPQNNANNQNNQFHLFGGQVGILSAGTLGKHFGYWGGVNVAANVNLNTGVRNYNASLERAYAIINPLKNHSYMVIRVGSFEPRLLYVSMHRSLLGGYFITGDRMVGNNAWTLEDSQQGLEIGGVIGKGRFGYAVGVVEGTGNRYNTAKDVFGRLEYKIGGLRLDGLEGEKSSTKKNVWRDDSITIGGFSYLGFATVVGVAGEQADRFYLVGGDLAINYANFITELAYVRQNNNRPLTASPNLSVGTNHFLGEVTYVYHWLVPGFRYEFFDNSQTRDHRLTFGSTFLVRPNIKVFVRGGFTKVAASGSFTDNPVGQIGFFLAL